MSPELAAAIAAADQVKQGPAYDQRGLFAAGPQMVTPSDVLARLMDEARGTVPEKYFAPDPHAQRHQVVAYRARTAYRRRYPTHGPGEFWFTLSPGASR